MIVSAMACSVGVLALREIARLHRALMTATIEARTDPLTGLGNRRRWDESTGALQAADDGFAFIVFDVANLKAANTAIGHAAADDILKRFAAEIRTGDLAGDRIGGDEFVIAMPGASLSSAIDARDRIEDAAGVSHIAPGAAVFLSGAPGRWSPGDDLNAALRAADAAMEARKADRKKALGLPPTREATIAAAAAPRARPDVMTAIQPDSGRAEGPTGPVPFQIPVSCIGCFAAPLLSWMLFVGIWWLGGWPALLGVLAAMLIAGIVQTYRRR